MINLQFPTRLWNLSKQMSLGAGSTANLFGSYYFGRRPSLKKVFPQIVVITLPEFGKVPIRTNGYDFGLLEQIFVRRDYRLDLKGVVPDNIKTILDLGANVGMAAVYLHKQFPGAQIACVEPSPANTELLKKAFTLNGISGQVFEAAIGAEDGTIDLYLSDQPDCNSVFPSAGSANTVQVRKVSVPSLMKQMGWDHIDLLKLDVEGAEKYIFEKNNSWLRQVRVITGESHVNVGYPYAQLARDLSEFGFVLEVLIPETTEYGASFRGVNTRFGNS